MIKNRCYLVFIALAFFLFCQNGSVLAQTYSSANPVPPVVTTPIPTPILTPTPISTPVAIPTPILIATPAATSSALPVSGSLDYTYTLLILGFATCIFVLYILKWNK